MNLTKKRLLFSIIPIFLLCLPLSKPLAIEDGFFITGYSSNAYSKDENIIRETIDRLDATTIFLWPIYLRNTHKRSL